MNFKTDCGIRVGMEPFQRHPQLLYMRYVARVPINSMNVSIEKGVIVRCAYDARLPPERATRGAQVGDLSSGLKVKRSFGARPLLVPCARVPLEECTLVVELEAVRLRRNLVLPETDTP